MSRPTKPSDTDLLARLDSWVNSQTSFGYGYDKASATCIMPVIPISPRDISNLYYGDPIAHRVVDVVPQEMFRRGYCLKSEKSPDVAKALQDQGKLLGLDEAMRDGAKWGRCWGGNLVILGLNDGQDIATPLRDGATSGIQFMQSVDRRFAQVYKRYTDPTNPKFGKPEIYMLVALTGGISYIHETRCVRFEGIPVDNLKDRDLAGWTYSVLQLPFDAIKKHATAYESATNLVVDASQAVFKLKGLWKQITSGSKNALQTLMRTVDLTRSTSRAVLLDTEEDFKREPTSFTGLPEMLDRYAILVSAATGIPVTLLMGRSPAGMNATGESDMRIFYDWIAAEQERVLTPILKRLYGYIGPLPVDLEIEWLPLYEPTDLEKAQTELAEEQAEKAKADKYAVYVGMGSLMAGQVAIAEFGSGEGVIKIDEAFIKEHIAAEQEQALNPPEPVDPNADPNAPPPNA